MSKITDLDSRRRHQVGDAKCVGCGHQWQARQPLGVNQFECPECGLEKAVWYGLHGIHPDERRWICNTCDGDLFVVTQSEALCVKCGFEHLWEDIFKN